MKTEQLIDALVADRGPASGWRLSRFPIALGLGILVSLAAFLATLGVRPDFMPSLETWRFDLKVAVMLLAWGLALSLCR
ncbi:MAG: DUF1109 family protein, partial [Alphaproteobacteria bacterium]|nr:DUF1109 family protein [Alphaproteobacteria bacterium]